MKLFRLLSFNHHTLRKKINTLELEKKDLEEMIKSDVFKKIIKKFDEKENVNRLRSENKKLRKKLKFLNNEKIVQDEVLIKK